jgi:hypothetical protein
MRFDGKIGCGRHIAVDNSLKYEVYFMADTPANKIDFYCSDCSRQVGEQIFGTAPQVDVWYALEHNGPWTRKAVHDCELPEAVRQRLFAELDGRRTRPVLISQQAHGSGAPVFFVAIADELQPRLYAFRLKRYEDLLELDLQAIVDGASRYDEHRQAEPVFLVCTNGKRDRACARYGAPVYHAMAAVDAQQAWRSTHLGGHRFAATALVLPHGYMFGHLGPAGAADLMRGFRHGKIDPAALRGQTCYSGPVQAAAHYLRRETGIHSHPGIRLVDAVQPVSQQWDVRFETLEDAQIYTVSVVTGRSQIEVFLSSGDETASIVPQYDLKALQRVALPGAET